VLVLFDIDGTLLLRASAEHAAALREALSSVYGVARFERVGAAGRTDTAIARDIAAADGVDRETFDAGIPDLQAACCAAFARLCPPSLAQHVAPGITQLLEGLAARGGVRCSLVTGNYEPVARLKLERTGIGRHFERDQGGFGSDAEDRDLLPAIARGRAGGQPRERTIVVGDTPADIACARADGLRVVVVATGIFTADQLTGADAVSADAFALAGVLERELLSAPAACR
jgi:phosphoglycolate phosphatase-like HAD superfamily hydrolase